MQVQGKGQQQRKATETSPCFENTEIFRGNPAVGKKEYAQGESVVQMPPVSSKLPRLSKIVMAARQKQWTGPGPRAAAGQQALG